MPSGSRKRKAAKKKKELAVNDDRQPPDPPKDPNPNPSTSVSLRQGNGHDGNEFSTPTSQEEAEERFETPRSQSDFIDTTIESFVKGGGEVKGEIFPSHDGEMVEKSLKENIESVKQSILVTENANDLDLVEKVDDSMKFDDESSEGKEFHENPEAFIEAVDNSIKEERFPSKDADLSVAEKGDDDAVGRSSEGNIQIDDGMKKLELEKSVTENSEALVESIETSSQDKEVGVLPKVDKGSKEINLDKLAVKNIVPIEHSVVIGEVKQGHKASTENCKRLACEIDNGKAKVLRVNDECLKEAKVDNLVAKENVIPLENSVFIEEVSQNSKKPAKNHETLVSVIDISSCVRMAEVLPLLDDAGEPTSDASGAEAAPRNEVAHGPLVARRATLWNCCGLLDVFTNSER